MEFAMAACLAALLMRRGCDRLNRQRRERILRELDWVAEGIDREALLDD
ncbi:MAG: hypothetical protein Q4E38_00965 [Eubacteriales bacterium]|nr:hypothetical protein [Eubacteriales bacterium]